MPISKIEIKEYQCFKCGYKWTNRVNGKNGPIPKRCAACKKETWNRKSLTREGVGIRKRIRNLKDVYRSVNSYCNDTYLCPDYWDSELAESFLDLDPPPSLEELRHALYPRGLVMDLRHHPYSGTRWYPDPQESGRLKCDRPPYRNYLRLVQQDAHRRQRAMRQIIKERKRQISSRTID